MSLIAVVLAAGQGTRMKSDLSKVLHAAAGRTLLDWALQAIKVLDPDRTVVVIGHEAGRVARSLPDWAEPVIQESQLGTGHAVTVALESLADLSDDDTILITYGDMPLVTSELLGAAAAARRGHVASMVTFESREPAGYGRIVRNGSGAFERVVEEKDANSVERAITEVNAGIYAFSGAALRSALGQVAAHNAQGEYYLPDVLPILIRAGGQVVTVSADPMEVSGVNSQDQLADADAELRRRINLRWQREGVWMQDPDRVYIDDSVELAPGVRLYPGVHLEGRTTVGKGAAIGPDAFVLDSMIGPGARVWYSVLRSAQVGEGAEVGPYASLRPGTVLESGSKAGTFVEIKNSSVGEGAKVPHLSYIGDARIGARVNVGAGSITCNYDGYEKHETVIGEGAFIGSSTMLVAPVVVGPGAFTGAGSVITRDVEAGALAVERSHQQEIPGYAARREERHRSKASEH
ncbi:MAG TPA: bifunctional UDP-N-acetylglucosamine diphosphorylase/glucosamine-1-phosphate N-acetyltransferase GlmU [Acidimicrobiia bacterium]|nr:bifunctional UDP-N-acetylglucosamine diphosphorylase/glucosamine-1-phosphate N-acetyltransferase GlmU [Acidimicrobiia bacterium]